MSVQQNPFQRYPEAVTVSNAHAVVYVLATGYYAVHFKESARIAPASAVQILGNEIAIFQGSPDSQKRFSQAATITAVYMLEPSGSMAVPTGQVMIRFPEGIAIESQESVIREAGYEIAQTLFYAPHTAWLKARSGEVADALCWISRLKGIDRVEHVEPQMVLGRSMK